MYSTSYLFNGFFLYSVSYPRFIITNLSATLKGGIWKTFEINMGKHGYKEVRKPCIEDSRVPQEPLLGTRGSSGVSGETVKIILV